MPDKKIWVGTTPDWTTGANWNPAGQPLDGDSVYFTGDSQQSVNGLTLGATLNDFVEFVVHPDYTGAIGTSGSKVVCGTITTLRFEGEGSSLFVSSTGLTDAIAATRAGIANMLEIAGTITRLHLSGCTGGVTITAAAALTNVDVHDSPSSVLTIGANVTGLNRFRMNSGRVINNSAISGTTNPGIALISGGLLEHRAGAVQQLWLQGTGIVEYTSAGTITQLYGTGPGSLFYGRKNRQPSVTITNSEGYPGFTCLLKNTMKSFVLTNNFKDFGANTDFETGVGLSAA